MPASTPPAEELILYPNKFKWTLYGVLFIGLGWLLLSLQDQLPDIREWLIAGAILSIAFMVACAIQLLPNSAWLKLNGDGLHYSVMFRRYHYPWSEIKRFGIVKIKFQYSSESLVSFWVEPNDRCISLHDSFGKKPEQLVEILESHRKRACGDS